MSFIRNEKMIVTRRSASSMAKDDTSYNARSLYRYIHLTPEELAHVPPAELLSGLLGIP
jgi:hypothetical protein